MYIPFTSARQVASALESQSGGDLHKSWLLCLADAHGEQLPKLLAECAARELPVCGGIFPGIIAPKGAANSGLIARPLLAGSQMLVAELSERGVSFSSPLPELENSGAKSASLFVDCLSPGINLLMEELYNCYGSSINFFGAGTGYRDLAAKPTVFAATRVLKHAALLVFYPQRSTVRVRHGWRRVDGPFIASRTDGRVIEELNWEPAANFYRQLVIGQNTEFAAKPLLPDIYSVFPLCVSREGSEDIIRDPIAFTETGGVKVLSEVRENSVLYLAHGDQDSLIAAAGEAVVQCGTHDDVDGCFISDCYSRALMLGDNFSVEFATVNRALKHRFGISPEGVLAFGEVAGYRGQQLEFFNKTFVVALSHR